MYIENTPVTPAGQVSADAPTLSKRAAAVRYVELLTGSSDTPMCWRAFMDPEQKRKAREPDGGPTWPGRAVEGPLAAVQAELQQFQKANYGVYAVVNEGGQKAKSVRQVRALFADKDGDKHGPAQRWQDVPWHLPPSFLTVDPADDYYWHAYWLVVDGFPLGRFTSAQKRLAVYYGADPRVSDLPRVMRVPGFKHLKDGPKDRVLVDLTGDAGDTGRWELQHSYEVVTAGLPELRNDDASPVLKARPDLQLDLDHNVSEARRRLRTYKPAKSVKAGGENPDGVDGDTYTVITANCLIDFGLSVDTAHDLLLEKDPETGLSWNDRCEPPWDEDALLDKVQSAFASRQNDPGCRAADPLSVRFPPSITTISFTLSRARIRNLREVKPSTSGL